MTQTLDAAEPAASPAPPNPSGIMQIGMGFWPSKTLLSAIELGLFTLLAPEPLTGPQIAERLDLRSRAVYDFLDGLVSLHLLDRAGSGETATYSNTPDTAVFLDANGPAYIGGILEMANARLYGFWDGLTDALRTGNPQNEVKHTGRSMFEELYADPARLEQFMRAMTGISFGNFTALAQTFDFSGYKTVCDVGGATGQLSLIVAEHNPHLSCVSFDLPVVQPIAQRTIDASGLGDRVTTAAGDFFADPLPSADVITMGMILHDWNLEKKKHLIKAAYDALPPGGALIAVENIIDDDRRQNVFGLMMSLNMLIEFGDAFDFTGADYRDWCEEAGFTRVEIRHLAGPASAAIAYK
jgi:predicted O-methyltransferase YrrM